MGKWITSVDLSVTYLHLHIHPLYCKFMRMHIEGQINLLQQVRKITVSRLPLNARATEPHGLPSYTGRLHLRPFHVYQASFHLNLRSHLETVLPLHPVFFLALQWWGNEGHLRAGIPLHLDPLFSDRLHRHKQK